MSHSESEEIVGLQPEVRWNFRRRLPGVVFAVTVAGLGGFLGGLMMSWGPQYLSIHVTEAVQDTPMQVASVEAPVPPPEVSVSESAEEVEPLPTGAEARLVVHSKKHSYVLIEEVVDPSIGIGKKRVRANDFRFTMTQDIHQGSVTPEMLLWGDRELTLFGKRGYLCNARVGAFQLLQQSDEDTDDVKEVSREWDGNSAHLVARLEPLRGSCKQATWARDVGLPAPALGQVGKAGKSMRKRARAAFRSGADWNQLQNEFKSQGGKGRWDSQYGSTPVVRTLRGPAEELVFVGVNTEGCGEFEAALGSVYRVAADGQLEEIERETFITDVSLAADFDADGDLDFISHSSDGARALVYQGATLREELRSHVIVNYCGC
jgi:hypothetical protein